MSRDRTRCEINMPCHQCQQGLELSFDFSMAFQPIVNVSTQTVFGYEALVRGVNNEPASWVLSQVNDENRYIFDQLCRVKAIALAARLKMTSILSINFMPNAIYSPRRCIRTSLEAANQYGFPTDRILFEFTETERIDDSKRILEIIDCYQALGFRTAIDDFGSGYAGLNLLADFQPNIVKLDMGLI